MPSREILNQLPYRLRSRFESLGGYVKTLIDAEEAKTKAKRRLTKSEVQLIQLIVFIHSLDFFFREVENPTTPNSSNDVSKWTAGNGQRGTQDDRIELHWEFKFPVDGQAERANVELRAAARWASGETRNIPVPAVTASLQST